jgi:hypothetical protein
MDFYRPPADPAKGFFIGLYMDHTVGVNLSTTSQFLKSKYPTTVRQAESDLDTRSKGGA